MARTDAEIRARTPLSVRFGDQDYQIQLLRVHAQREWRKRLVTELGVILGNFSLSADQVGANVFHGGLISALVQCPEKLADLLFEYAPDLPKDQILESATEEQVIFAFSAVMEVALPFLAVLKTATQVLSSELSAYPKA
jgi:hypothetical protein